MSFTFTNKSVLIISPEPWGTMKISKHHYAIELAKLGNYVYFLNPPNGKKSVKYTISIEKEAENLQIIDFNTFFPTDIRFHFRGIFEILMRFQILFLLRWLKVNFDVVWCFDFNLYDNLNQFKAKIKIYHPVDILQFDFQLNPAKTADIIFSVSDELLKPFKGINIRKVIINHGLSDHFVNKAKRKQLAISNLNNLGTIKAGYVGNLLNYTLNKKQVIEIIKKNPQVQFYFWGGYSLLNNNLAPDISSEDEKFIEILQQMGNVILKGMKSPEIIAEEIEEMDLFFITYIYPDGNEDRYNSHKILEYLSTGKVVVCSYLSYYEDKRDLIQMVKKGENAAFPQLFSESITLIEELSQKEKQIRRISFALENSYSNHIHKVEHSINDLLND
jgi:hypothetical protein